MFLHAIRITFLQFKLIPNFRHAHDSWQPFLLPDMGRFGLPTAVCPAPSPVPWLVGVAAEVHEHRLARLKVAGDGLDVFKGGVGGAAGLGVPEAGVDEEVVGVLEFGNGRFLFLGLRIGEPLIPAVEIPEKGGFRNGRFHHKPRT